jgi:hypothetical protein
MKCLSLRFSEGPCLSRSTRTAVASAIFLGLALGPAARGQAPAAPQPGTTPQPSGAGTAPQADTTQPAKPLPPEQSQGAQQATPAAPATPQQPAATSSGPELPASTPGNAASPKEANGPTPVPTAESSPIDDKQGGGITEDEIKQLLAGKTLYLRGGYLDGSLSFDEHGKLIGNSPQGSYTLSLVEIDKVHLSKHKVELIGIRYGMHFLGARADEDPTKAVDKVRITPKKKVLKITIDRELVVTPKKKKQNKGQNPSASKAGSGGDNQTLEPDDIEQAKAEINTAPEAERPADSASVTTTTSPAHAAKLLRDAIDRIFAPGLDERMIASMPGFWKLYYDAAAKQTDYRPQDPGIYRQTEVDQKAKLLSTFEPPSNEYAQNAGVAGMALYHAVIGADGKPQEIVVGRPIGFGLDENAAETIRRATFQPAMKDGKPVPVLLDLVVQFRIYSKRTDQPAKPDAEEAIAGPKLPGPYSVMH